MACGALPSHFFLNTLFPETRGPAAARLAQRYTKYLEQHEAVDDGSGSSSTDPVLLAALEAQPDLVAHGTKHQRQIQVHIILCCVITPSMSYFDWLF